MVALISSGVNPIIFATMLSIAEGASLFIPNIVTLSLYGTIKR